MIIKSQNKDLVVDTNGNEFRMFCGPDGRYAIETRAGVLGVYKTKKQAEKVLDEIAEQIGCCKADEIIYAGRGIGGLRVTVYQLLHRNTYIKCQKKRRKMMLIRRQDKKAIFNIDTCRVLYVAETVGGCFKICADQFEQLGTYKTEERAMEVLDMIATQSALCNAGVAVYLVDEIEKAWYMDMPEE